MLAPRRLTSSIINLGRSSLVHVLLRLCVNVSLVRDTEMMMMMMMMVVVVGRTGTNEAL